MSTDLIKLYSQRILALAADIPLTDRLNAPDVSGTKRSPLCGSTVTVDLNLDGDQITAFGQDVKACALGQASASVIGKVIVGQQKVDVERGRNQLADMLAGGPPPTAPFDGLTVLEPAKDYKNRHASILLTFDAILKAFANKKDAAT